MKNAADEWRGGRRDGGTGGNGKRSLTTVVDPVEGLEPLPELPASERVFLTDGDIRVPVRRISVGAGEPPVDVYDPSGPRAADLHVGLPKLRQPWIDRARRARRRQLQPDALRPPRRDHRGDAVRARCARA